MPSSFYPVKVSGRFITSRFPGQFTVFSFLEVSRVVIPSSFVSIDSHVCMCVVCSIA
jgi:hypothetical protein